MEWGGRLISMFEVIEIPVCNDQHDADGFIFVCGVHATFDMYLHLLPALAGWMDGRVKSLPGA